jgi:formylglycine-generating enzyme required for sulfatase activity
MDETEVTVGAFRGCVDAARCKPFETVDWTGISEADRKKRSQACNWGKPDRDRHPINCVDWDQATAFCAWAAKRLPTEEEWEYAARGTEGRKYPWGDSEPGPSLLNACGSECTEWAKKNLSAEWKPMYPGNDGWPTTAPVGAFPAGASPLGLLDMAGNVWEWTSSGWSDDYSKNRTTDGRVDRGGGWSNVDASDVRGASRSWFGPSLRSLILGLRCAR